MRRAVGIWGYLWLVALLLSPLGLVHGSDLERRLDRLEAQMERILQHLEGQSTDGPASAGEAPPVEAPARQPERTPADAPAPASAPPAAPVMRSVPSPTTGEARLSYFMDTVPLGTTPPDSAPLARGLYTLEDDLRMDPYRYGAAERRLVGGYRDASEHRAVGMLLEGYLEIPQTGVHQFEVAPKPAREGGGSPIVNEMTVYLWVDGEPLITLERVRGWRHQLSQHHLVAGSRPFRLWVVSNSPGYGAPPIDSRLEMAVSMPGRAQNMPLWRLMRAPE